MNHFAIEKVRAAQVADLVRIEYVAGRVPIHPLPPPYLVRTFPSWIAA